MTSKVSDYSRLPQELRQLDQWCVAGADKAPYVASGDTLRRVSVHEVAALHTFEDACLIAKHFGVSLGFILTATDGLCCIDLDVKDANSKDKDGQPIDSKLWTTQADLDRFQSIIDTFQTYGELSQSGQGAHLWLLGDIGKGVRRDSVELYSQERFIICTGDSFSKVQFNLEPQLNTITAQVVNQNPLPINGSMGGALASMGQQMAPAATSTAVLVETDEEHSDAKIVQIAMGADNADKFNQLCVGDWAAMDYPSQSEADLALMSMLTFYSDSNAQCRRIFRHSGLGKRDKSIRDDVYINRTLKLIRGRQENEQVAALHGQDLATQLIQSIQQQGTEQIEAAPLAIEQAVLPAGQDHELAWPPGLAGAIAGFIYNHCNRPVREVAIVAALGFLAGICGKAYCANSKTGLNIYMTLIGPSGIGKEGLHDGIQALIRKLGSIIPSTSQFFSFDEMRSAPALIKKCAEQPSFVNVIRELGQKFQQMSKEDGRDGPMKEYRTTLTSLYSKSGPKSVAGGMVYSNADDNIQSVAGVAYSLIGESTPEVFYQSLTPGMMEDGFLSRFTMVECLADRPRHNYDQIEEPDENLTNALVGLVTQACNILGRYENQIVEYSPETQILAKAHDELCDDQINSTKDESFRQMWNRAHLKVLRIASLLAVADNWITPVVSVDHFEWAKGLVHRDITLTTKHIAAGDVGVDDGSREKKMLGVMKDYLQKKPSDSYNILPKMRSAGVIPKRYIQVRCSRMAAFKAHKVGTTYGIDNAIKSLTEMGHITELDRMTVINEYGKHERAFRIIDI